MILSENESKWTYVGIGIALLILILLPWIISGYWVRLLTAVFMFAVLAKGIDLMMGYTGYVPFGNVVFFGLGAYTTGILMSRGWPFVPGMLIGILMSVFVCIVFGTPVLRLRGHYFAVATIGLNGAIMAIALNATALTGGAMGIIFPPLEMNPAALNRVFYFVMMMGIIPRILIKSVKIKRIVYYGSYAIVLVSISLIMIISGAPFKAILGAILMGFLLWLLQYRMYRFCDNCGKLNGPIFHLTFKEFINKRKQKCIKCGSILQ